jgi:uncharacterized protein YceK
MLNPLDAAPPTVAAVLETPDDQLATLWSERVVSDIPIINLPGASVLDQRQLLLPLVLTHERMLPGILSEIAPKHHASTGGLRFAPAKSAVPNRSRRADALRHSCTRR